MTIRKFIIKKFFVYLKRLLVSIIGDLYCLINLDLRRRLISESFKQYIEYKKYPYYFLVGNASSYCLEEADLYCDGKGVDVGGSIFPLKNARVIENNLEENALNIIENNDSLDFVFSSHCMEHLDLEEQGLFFKEVYRVLKPNGIFYVYMPIMNASFWKEEYLSVHKSISSTKVLVNMANKVGFKTLNVNVLPDLYYSKRLIFQKNLIN
jgi:SAM-dependent methyltransferase